MTDYEGLRARKLQQQLTNMERRAIKAEKGVALERNRSNNYLTKIVALLNRNEELERKVRKAERGSLQAVRGHTNALQKVDHLRTRNEALLAERDAAQREQVRLHESRDAAEARARRAEDALQRVTRALCDEEANLADDGARLSHAVVRRLRAALSDTGQTSDAGEKGDA